MGWAEFEQNRRCIRYPSNTETFYGAAEQVVLQTTERVAEQEAA
jgi:hypothetical protein